MFSIYTAVTGESVCRFEGSLPFIVKPGGYFNAVKIMWTLPEYPLVWNSRYMPGAPGGLCIPHSFSPTECILRAPTGARGGVLPMNQAQESTEFLFLHKLVEPGWTCEAGEGRILLYQLATEQNTTYPCLCSLIQPEWGPRGGQHGLDRQPSSMLWWGRRGEGEAGVVFRWCLWSNLCTCPRAP